MNLYRMLTILLVACLPVMLAACFDSESSNTASSSPSPTTTSDDTRATVQNAGTESEVSAPQCAHGAPKRLCFICDPSLRDEGRLWCREHGRYEDRCWKCHPELEDKDRLYCQEHFLYEDECFLCHPELAPDGQQPSTPAGSEHQHSATGNPGQGLMCQEHGMPESECGICHPELAKGLQIGQGLQIRFRSPEAASKAGVATEQPGVGEVAQSVTCYAELTFNQNKLAEITPLVSGMIQTVPVDLGDSVETGDLLATISSIGIADAQSRFLKALAQVQLSQKRFRREERLHAKEITSAQDLQEAEASYESAKAALEAARQELETLGFSQRQIETLATDKKGGGRLELRAPFAGEIVERNAVQGSMASVGQALFKVADRSNIWAILKIPESKLVNVETGQTVALEVEAFPDETFTGRLTWISAEIDHRTRMAKARAEFPNPKGRLKAHMFATARIHTGAPDRAILVPHSAIQFVQERPFAFVQVAPDLFSAQPLVLGPKTDEICAVFAGLEPTDSVVTQGSFAVKSQFLISRLGAGCVHE